MICEIMYCISDCLVTSNLVISLVPYDFFGKRQKKRTFFLLIFAKERVTCKAFRLNFRSPIEAEKSQSYQKFTILVLLGAAEAMKTWL